MNGEEPALLMSGRKLAQHTLEHENDKNLEASENINVFEDADVSPRECKLLFCDYIDNCVAGPSLLWHLDGPAMLG